MSYSRIVFTEKANVFTWNYPYTGGITISDINDIESSLEDVAATMPPANSIALGTIVTFNNIGKKTIEIAEFGSNELIVAIEPSSAVDIYLVSNTDAQGDWRYIQPTGVSGGITSLTINTSEKSPLIIEGSPVDPGTSGKISIDVNSVLEGIGNLNSQGIVVSKSLTADSFVTRKLKDGNGIRISNPAGIDDDITIGLEDNIGDIQQISVGNLTINDSLIKGIADEDVLIQSNTANKLILNNVSIDFNANITGINDITINGNLNLGKTSFTNEGISSDTPLILNQITIDSSGNLSLPDKAQITTGGLNVSTITIGDLSITDGKLTDADKININKVIFDSEGNVAVPSTAILYVDKIKPTSEEFVDINSVVISNEGDITTEGDVNISGNLSVKGNIITTEGIKAVTDIVTEGNLSATGNITSKGDITTVGNLTVNQINASSINLDTPYSQPGATTSQCFFRDNNTLMTTPIGNQITIEETSRVNIKSVTGGNGLYNITFDQEYKDSTYIVQATLSASTIIAPIIAFFGDRATTGFNLLTIDNLGRPIPVTGGVCISVWGLLVTPTFEISAL